MKRLFAGLLVFCVCAFAQAQAAPKPPKSNVALCEDLRSKVAVERMQAAKKLVAENTELKNCLLRQLQVEVVNPSREFNGSFSQLLWVLGKLRVSAAVGDLVPLIELRLTGTPGQGGFGGPQVYYPVACALVEIGGPNLNQGLFRRMAQPADENLIRVTTWVLLKHNSKSVLRFMIQNELDDVTRVLKLIGVTDTNPEKRNLERMLQLLESTEQILPPENQPTTGKPAPAR